MMEVCMKQISQFRRKIVQMFIIARYVVGEPKWEICDSSH